MSEISYYLLVLILYEKHPFTLAQVFWLLNIFSAISDSYLHQQFLSKYKDEIPPLQIDGAFLSVKDGGDISDQRKGGILITNQQFNLAQDDQTAFDIFWEIPQRKTLNTDDVRGLYKEALKNYGVTHFGSDTLSVIVDGSPNWPIQYSDEDNRNLISFLEKFRFQCEKMKGVVLAGGTGSRLLPLTKVTNKHLLPVGNQPMIYYPVQKLVQAGIKDILIITGVEHMGAVVGLLGSGKAFNCNFTYRVQDEAGGIAQALQLAEHFAQGGNISVILGDNIFQDNISEAIQGFKEQDNAHLFLKEVPDPNRFGVATMQGGQISKIVEKPVNPDSNHAVTGIYIFNNRVFDFIQHCTPSQRGELEISDVNQHYLNNGGLKHTILNGWWSDAGTFPSLKRATEYVNIDPIHA